MKPKYIPLLLIALFSVICPTVGAANVTYTNWQRAESMYKSLNIAPQSRLGLDFRKDLHQRRTDPSKTEAYLSTFRDLKRLQSHVLVLNWILSQTDALAELRVIAGQELLLANQESRKIFSHVDVAREVDETLLHWDKEQIPSLQKIYPDFFDAGENEFESRLFNQLRELIKKKDSLKLPSIDGRYWGWRPLKLIQSLVIHHTETSDINEIYRKHISEGRFEGDLAPFIAYHFLIDTKGRILFLNALNEKVWHVRGANGTSIGIALLGNLDEGQATAAQFDSLEKLTRFLVHEFNINPKTNIHGHGELTWEGNDTNCPGTFGRELIQQLKNKLNHSPAKRVSNWVY